MGEQEILSNIVKELRKVFDPEIPVNIYDLGLVYKVDVDENGKAYIQMTLTAPNCPVADSVVMMTETAVKRAEGVKDVNVELVFEPQWDKSMMNDEAKLELGML
ncbi:MAG: iron-sulfur cluster assembly protein [Candidatus Delongbacteria bacterium]|jgi:FeS assembly SUF system protein|nr:iron-sulfur cluster assembly protein [Candidatus Delongbacteria bacterium]